MTPMPRNRMLRLTAPKQLIKTKKMIPAKPIPRIRPMNPPARRKRRVSSGGSFRSAAEAHQTQAVKKRGLNGRAFYCDPQVTEHVTKAPFLVFSSFRNLNHHHLKRGNPLTCVPVSRTFLLNHFLPLAGAFQPREI